MRQGKALVAGAQAEGPARQACAGQVLKEVADRDGGARACMAFRRFWGEVLVRRSELELRDDVYELAGGVAAAERAGAQAPQ